MVRIGVFASGSGTNLQSILDHFHRARPGLARVGLVVSDRERAGALVRAREAGVDTRVIGVIGRSPAEVADETLAALADAGIGLVALAGYLRMVPAAVVARYRGRIVNIHPALLPAFGGERMYGLHVHRAVLATGSFVTGVTVHHVDERYDEGRPLAQWPVPVLRGDTPESLAARVLEVEHALYPLVIEGLARGIEAATVHPDDSAPAGPGFSAPGSAGFEWSHAAADRPALRRILGLQEETT